VANIKKEELTELQRSSLIPQTAEVFAIPRGSKAGPVALLYKVTYRHEAKLRFSAELMDVVPLGHTLPGSGEDTQGAGIGTMSSDEDDESNNKSHTLDVHSGSVAPDSRFTRGGGGGGGPKSK
jgi:hypothetical protein